MPEAAQPVLESRAARLRNVAGFCLLLVAAAACGDSDPVRNNPDGPTDNLVCDLNTDLLVSQVAPGAIPALTEPPMVTLSEPGAAYLEDSDRVLGVVVDGSARAYPHPVLDHHEVVNDRIGDEWFTVTFCPLTGSGLRIDPEIGGQRLDVGVSGLLFANNLVVFDRTTGEVYGPQLSVAGKCSSFRGQSVKLLPVMEMSWGEWRNLYPNTLVVSSATGFNRNYLESPYAQYRQNEDLLHDMPVDESRPLKERVLGIRIGEDGGMGYPIGELQSALGSHGVLNEVVAGDPTAIFYEQSAGEAAIAFHAEVDGQTLTFDAQSDGTWTDQETGSTWRLDGLATDGPLAGSRLDIRDDAYMVYWFAWRHFQPNSETWTG